MLMLMLRDMFMIDDLVHFLPAFLGHFLFSNTFVLFFYFSGQKILFLRKYTCGRVQLEQYYGMQTPCRACIPGVYENGIVLLLEQGTKR